MNRWWLVAIVLVPYLLLLSWSAGRDHLVFA